MSDGMLAKRSPNRVERHDEALEVLLILRRRLLDRMAGVIVENREKLLNGTSRTNNPLASSADLAEMIRNLGEVDRAITGLAELGAGVGAMTNAGSNGNGNVSPDSECGIFSRFVELVRSSRFEEASQELSKTLAMPLDRVITATRFFARTLKTDPMLPSKLGRFLANVGDMTQADAIKTIMRLFGFQAVEARISIQALLAKPKPAPAAAAR
jgi:hypothetical protein